jgi:hypothetical protein
MTSLHFSTAQRSLNASPSSLETIDCGEQRVKPTVEMNDLQEIPVQTSASRSRPIDLPT